MFTVDPNKKPYQVPRAGELYRSGYSLIGQFLLIGSPPFYQKSTFLRAESYCALSFFTRHSHSLVSFQSFALRRSLAPMSASLPGSRDLPASPYDLKTYWGRVRHAADLSDPR